MLTLTGHMIDWVLIVHPLPQLGRLEAGIQWCCDDIACVVSSMAVWLANAVKWLIALRDKPPQVGCE